MVRKIFRIIGILLLAVIVLAGALLLWLTLTEYKPAATEDVTPTAGTASSAAPAAGDSVSILSWNIGYAGLGKGSDFFMDGGKNSRSADRDTVNAYLSGIAGTIKTVDPDVTLLQEVDENSTRTYHINERDTLSAGANSTYALNYSCKFVPYPLPPIGTVNSGLLTMTGYSIESAQRVALPCPFNWPLRIANLKRCLLVNYIPLANSDKYLVMVDLHLEAYDSGEGKIAQTKMLNEFIQSEYEKGNYVIAGGDFNQEFPGALDAYPNNHPDLWSPGTLDAGTLPDGWHFACDLSVPSCRLDNQPYNAADTANTQHYVIDGFILSPNVELETVNTLDEGFTNSDHNPVLLKVTLKAG